MVDTHTHLYLSEFEPEKADVVRRAIETGVDKMIFPNIDSSSIPQMKELHELFPKNIYLAMGLHPTELDADWENQLLPIEKELNSGFPYIAIGEVGVDLYWEKKWREQQMQAFERQCMWAVEKNLPLIIHCREALDEILEVLSGLPESPRGVMHSFGGTVEDVERIRSIVPEFYFGINGIVTFKNSKLRDVLQVIGLDKILLETDAPYLAPVPMRGRRNESSFIIHTAANIAHSLDIPVEEVDAKTTANAQKLFAIC